ncbi:LysM peptidoglycan-binding domain-containing protein [sulfur-oxidizing endosymbiont of Gigantopelta aegis]|uniref:LysM peptidoglycan-binding domain-containing protein n=1 Tax=sulfur-oxidizing endosymbiont of Gigantopelta aegis TaxID=2794934 RepID=UPI0018DD77AE|nr:LysM domain-containing protein [sulfur-oxidizing endosymbiont of Gigantopelta aegis]
MKNNKRFLTQTLAILLLSSALFVSAQAEKIKLKPGHPEEYVVVKGDTLWDISGKFLSEPWLWPEIWQINPQVKNPHLIYPGDVLYLVYIDGKPYITRNKHGKRTVRLSPETRIEALDNAIPTIPLDIIAPFLTKNRVLNFGEFANLPYIAGMTDDRSAAGAGDSVYVVGIPQESTDTHYAVYRRGNAYRNPRNDRKPINKGVDIFV